MNWKLALFALDRRCESENLKSPADKNYIQSDTTAVPGTIFFKEREASAKDWQKHTAGIR
jgi:hypothetical protein